jgi:hypothetical protein
VAHAARRPPGQALFGRWPPALVRGEGRALRDRAGGVEQPLLRMAEDRTSRPPRSADGRVVVEVRGVDVYDPTTGVIRSSSTDDIACWFIDTSYNEESFFSCATLTSPAPTSRTSA